MTIKTRFNLAVACALLVLCGVAEAQTAAPQDAAAAGRALGAVTKVDPAARVIVLKTDTGAEINVTLVPTASFRRVAPGETDLKNAATIALGDVGVGDRVLARGKSSEDQKSIAANLVVVMSQGDIAKKQAADRADWDRRGVNGVVTAVSSESVTVSVRGVAGAARSIVVIPAANAIIRRYAPDSVKFSDAKASTLAEMKPGDQVRARGTRSDDGTKLSAEEVVSGSFRTLAGVILSIDAQANTVRINDLVSKKPVLVIVNPDSTVRKLQPQTAQFLAARLRGGPDAAGGPGGGNGPGANGAGPGGNGPAGSGAGGNTGGGARPAGGGPGPGGGGEGRAGGGGARGGGDLSQMIDRTPAATLADLKTGDALVISSTVGARPDEVTAITLLAGVEPILTKPGTQQLGLGDWNMGDLGGGIGAP